MEIGNKVRIIKVDSEYNGKIGTIYNHESAYFTKHSDKQIILDDSKEMIKVNPKYLEIIE